MVNQSIKKQVTSKQEQEMNELLNNINYEKIVEYEIEKIKNDLIYFTKNYAYIQHPIRGIIPFELYDFQEKTLREFQNNSWNIVLKSRQMGISTLLGTYIVWKMITNEAYTVNIIANKEKTAKELITKVKLVFELMPEWILKAMNIKTLTDNALSVILSNRSKVEAQAASEDAGRSSAGSLVVWDEMAFSRSERINKEIWTSIVPVLSTGGDLICFSTPNGKNGVFYENWQGAILSENTFNPIKLRWDLHPDRDQAWRDDMTKKFGERESNQEYDCNFATSGNNVIGSKTINWYETNCIKDPISKRFNEYLWIWEEAKEDCDYIISVDVARGDGQDLSAFHVFKDLKKKDGTIEQVAEFNGRVPTSTLAKFVVTIGIEYNTAFVIIENNSIGWATLQKVMEMYQNVYMSPKSSNIYINNNLDTIMEAFMDFDSLIPGFSTNSKTRDFLINELEERLRLHTVIIHSVRYIAELNNFIWKSNGRADHRDGKHDDLIISSAIGMFVDRFTKKLSEGSFDLQSQLLDAVGANSEKESKENTKIDLDVMSTKKKTNTMMYQNPFGENIEIDMSEFI